MTWIPLSVLTAVFESAKDILCKERLRAADPFLVAFAWRACALPLLLPPFFFFRIPTLGRDYGWALLVSGGINALTAVLYMKALKASDLSLTVPMVALTPLFLLLVSPLLLGEYPGMLGVSGVLLMVVGSYRLGGDGAQRGLVSPFRALLRERGPRLMLIVAILWSVSGTVDKIGVRNSSPLFWAASLHLAICLALLPAVIVRCRRVAGMRAGDVAGLVAAGAAGGLGAICQMSAINMTLVPYVIAIKRTSTVMSSLWGHLFLGEKDLQRRLPAVLLMVAGAVLVTLD